MENFYKNMFTLGALWNFGIGFTGLIFANFAVMIFFGPGVRTGDFLGEVMLKIVMLAIIIFGTGYFLVSRSIEHNRGLVWLGLLSKLILFVLISYYFFTGRASVLGFLAVTGDFLWSIGFFHFLWNTRDSVKVHNFIG